MRPDFAMAAKTGLGVALLVTALAVTAPGQTGGFVSVRGPEIVAPDGKPMLLRGINLGNWLVPEGYMFKFESATSPRMINDVIAELIGEDAAEDFWNAYRDAYITRDDLRFSRELGLNSVRIPFHWNLFSVRESDGALEGPGVRLMDRVIGWCRDEHLWAILDMHCAPGGQTGDNIDDSRGYPFLFESARSQERVTKIWTAIAARYRNESTVLGYDLLNEPIATYFDSTALNPLLEPLYRRITAGIRSVDTNHLVFLGGAQWDGNFRVFGPPFDAKLVYTFHRYWCDTTQAMIQEFVDFRTRYSVPLWMGESGENTDEWIDAWRRLQERNNIGWCFWPYKKMDASRNLVTFPRPDGWDVIVKYANSTRSSYADIRDARPDTAVVREALRQFLQRCRFSSCRLNPGYARSLGLTVPR